MKRNKEKVPGFDDIIFENRNKEYGAYMIRKKYYQSTLWSVFSGVSIFTILTIIFATFPENKATGDEDNQVIVVVKTDPVLADPVKLKPEEPEKPSVRPGMKITGPPEVAPDASVITDIPPADLMIDSASNKPVNQADTTDGLNGSIFNSEPEPAIFVEEMPSYPGGPEELLKFINENIDYPDEAVENGIEGRVIMRFVVSSSGSVTRIEVLKSVHPVIDNEASRVISMLPAWKPGRQNGKPVPVWFSVPVTFRIKRD